MSPCVPSGSPQGPWEIPEEGRESWGSRVSSVFHARVSPHTQGELFHWPGLKELMVLRAVPASGGAVSAALAVRGFLGCSSIPQAQPLTCSTKGHKHVGGWISKLQFPNFQSQKVGTEPPRSSCHPLPSAPEVPGVSPSLLPKRSPPHPPAWQGRGAGKVPGSSQGTQLSPELWGSGHFSSHFSSGQGRWSHGCTSRC